jgi:hypothetical protein
LQSGADDHDAQGAVQEFVQLHLAAAFFAFAHHQKVELFAGEVYGDLVVRWSGTRAREPHKTARVKTNTQRNKTQRGQLILPHLSFRFLMKFFEFAVAALNLPRRIRSA